MIDQLIIGDKASFDDFGASIASRKIGQPKKKSIKETVPFSNVTYDFSAINGEIYWEERILEYVFEMTASTPEKLELAKIAFADWVMNVMNENIHDPFIPDYHFVGTYDNMEFADDEDVEKTTVNVTFTVYPYKISNYPKGHEVTVPGNASITLAVVNESSHKISPTITSDGQVTIETNGTSITVGAGTFTASALKLLVGVNSVTITNRRSASGTVQITFNEEVF